MLDAIQELRQLGNGIIQLTGTMYQLVLDEMRDVESEEKRQLTDMVFGSTFYVKGSLYRLNINTLRTFINIHFVPNVRYHYDWCALYLLLYHHHMLRTRNTLCSFAQQMNLEGWFPEIQATCTADALGEYAFLREVPRQQWTSGILEGHGDCSRKGYLRICRIYDTLESVWGDGSALAEDTTPRTSRNGNQF